ncbi:hypothetical protein [Clostridium perfringens]|uniref:Glycosyltransferase RgtA/B/C/D-like domain-containing protein n=1 Tax=Clostridium perfringens TaxID=1502 RepID=A0A133N9T2_CLOPF|nr:hypothetical protein [Clostridium perfringens]EGT3601026.1 hypothetical protein [Clostridium perfringens]KXA12993.1 hypothetical protein HMPREF3222_01026 [Clostridium perfringens]MBS5921209.1 hypothetical protein [Clostridium perfringens]
MKKSWGNLKNNRLSYYMIIISFMFLIFIGSIFIGNSILFIFKLPVNRLSIIIFPAIGLILSKFILNKDGEKIKWRYMIVILILFYLIIITLGIINNIIWDSSYDSLSYHQEGVIRLKDGWNPFYEQSGDIDRWVKHYTKAPWIFAASIYTITGRIESAKVLNMLLPIIVFLLGFAFFYLVTKKKTVISLLGALILAINPVNISQMFTYYVDAALGIYIIILIITLFFILFYEDLFYFKYFSLINIATFLVNIKFTGLAYAGVILAIFLICNFIYSSKSYNIKLVSFLFISFIFSVMIIGFNPYVTNTLNNGNPLYPLSGKNKIDIMTNNTPEEFRYDSEFQKAYKALIAPPSVDNKVGKAPKSFSEMFEIKEGTRTIYAAADTRLRGFGIYSVIFLPISFLFLIYSILKCKDKKLKVCSILLLLGLAFVIIYCGDFWWARYISFIWAIPVLTYVSMAISENKFIKGIGWIFLIVMLINSTIMIPSTLEIKTKLSNRLKQEILVKKEIQNDEFKFSKVNKAKEFNLTYKIVD